jgi:uncharacterized protein DUF4440
MADLAATIETAEHRFMRAWVNRDTRALKGMTSGSFVLLVGSTPPVMLDQRSWLDASGTRFDCSAYRFGTIYVRDHGSIALFAARVDLEAKLDGKDWSGPRWVTDLWRKGRVRRRWKLVERVMSRVEEDGEVPAAIRSMQLWR